MQMYKEINMLILRSGEKSKDAFSHHTYSIFYGNPSQRSKERKGNERHIKWKEKVKLRHLHKKPLELISKFGIDTGIKTNTPKSVLRLDGRNEQLEIES